MNQFEPFRLFSWTISNIFSRLTVYQKSVKLFSNIPWNVLNWFHLKTTRKSCWQPEMSGWIQATMQQNTITHLYVRFYLCWETKMIPYNHPEYLKHSDWRNQIALESIQNYFRILQEFRCHQSSLTKFRPDKLNFVRREKNSRRNSLTELPV